MPPIRALRRIQGTRNTTTGTDRATGTARTATAVGISIPAWLAFVDFAVPVPSGSR
jgi:hypothetical protein